MIRPASTSSAARPSSICRLMFLLTVTWAAAGCGFEDPLPRTAGGPQSPGPDARPKPYSGDARDPGTSSADHQGPPGTKTLQDFPSLSLNQTTVVADKELGLELPVISFALKHADFAQVMRCTTDFRMRKPSGERLTPTRVTSTQGEPPGVGTTQLSEDTLQALSWAWRDALAAGDSCQLVALRALPGHFQETLRPETNSAFYYALNPCTLDPQAPDDFAAARCSFALAISEDLAPLKKSDLGPGTMFETLSVLAMARSDAEGHATRLQALAATGSALVPICQKQETREQTLAMMRQGLGQLAAIGVGALAAQAGGLLALPPVQAAIRKTTADLFARKPKVPPACFELAAIMDTAKQVSERHAAALHNWEQLMGQLGAQRPGGAHDDGDSSTQGPAVP